MCGICRTFAFSDGCFPKAVLRKPKTGFGVPIREWMHGRLGDLAWRTILSERALSRGIFDPDALNDLHRKFQERRVDTPHLLYSLLFLELWHRQFIDQFSPRPDSRILE